MWLWHSAFEAGPNRKTQTSSATNALSTFVTQDIWQNISSVNSFNIIDADAGGSPHCGRYALKPVNLGFGDPGKFVGYTYSRSGTTIWWSQRVKVDGFDSMTNLAVTQVYTVGKFNYNDGVRDSGNKYMGFGLTVVDATTPQLSWSLLYFNSDNSYNSTLITSGTPFTPSSGWVWLQAELNTSTGDIKFFVDDTQIGVTINPGGTWSSVPAIRYSASMTSGKSSDSGIKVSFCCMGSNDSNGTIANARPPSTIKVILHQPEANQTHQWSGAGYLDVADEAATCPRYSNTIIASNIGDVDLYNIKDKNAAGTVESIHIVFDQSSPGANPAHTIRARISGGTYQDYTSPKFSIASAGGRYWVGQEFQQTVEASPVNWTNSLFNTLDAGLKAVDTTNDMGEFYVTAIGPNLVRALYNSCGGSIKTAEDGQFTAKPVKVWNGSAWVVKSMKYWNGSSWVTTPY